MVWAVLNTTLIALVLGEVGMVGLPMNLRFIVLDSSFSLLQAAAT